MSLDSRRDAFYNDIEDAQDLNISPPKAAEAMLYGLAGDIGRTAAETTEANKYAACMDTLTLLSAEFGRDIYLPIGNTYHHSRLFVLHTGRTGRGRKGDALSLPLRIRAKTAELYLNLAGQIHTGGLSSREGLTNLIHDGYRQGKEEVPAIDDKRLFVVEPEFSNVLHQAKREGNTLSSALRDVFDGGDIKPLTRSSQMYATAPHIALLGHITPSELVELMRSRELSNGFANRFLIFFAERERLIPHPQPTAHEIVYDYAARFKEVISFAKGDYPYVKNSRPASLTPSASKRYSEIYYELSKPLDGGIIDAILERRPANLLRLALTFALTDLTRTIETKHIDAAYAWILYCTQSVRFIFQSGQQELDARESEATAQKVLKFLKDKGESSRTVISNDLFKRHKSSLEIDASLKFLLAESPPQIEMYEPAKKGNGRTPKIYRYIAANKANYANNQQRRGLEAVNSICELSELSELSHPVVKVNSHYSHYSQTVIKSESLDTPDTSRNSLNSQEDIKNNPDTDDVGRI
jgi:hypothetical protein